MFLYEFHIFTNKILVVHKDDPLPYYPRRSGHEAVLMQLGDARAGGPEHLR